MPRYYFSLFVFLFLISSIANSQSIIDSLKNELNTNQSDIQKVNTLLEFYDTDLYYDDQLQVVDYLHEALAISKRANYVKGEIESRNNLGYIYRVRSESDSAFFHYNKAIVLAKKEGDYKEQINSIMGKGNTYNQLSQWSEAIASFNEVINIATEVGDSVEIGSAYNNIGNTYLNQAKLEEALISYQKSAELGDDHIKEVALINMAVVHTNMNNLEKAKTYFTQSMKMAKDLDKRAHVAFILKNLGVLEKKSKNYAQSLEYYDQALEYYYKQSDDYSIGEITYNQGNVYFDLKEYNKAIDKYRESLTIREKIENKSGVCECLLAIGSAEIESNKVNAAKSTILEAEACANEINHLTAQHDGAQLLTIIYEKEGNHKKALDYQKLLKKYGDSLNSIRNEEAIADLDTKYQTKEKEQEIELLSKENEVSSLKLKSQQNLRNFLLITAAILTLLLFTIFNQYRIKTKTNEKLRELDTLKSTFFTNISHEFRTPLTLVLSPLDKLIETVQETKVKNYAKLAKRNATRLLELTNQLLDLSKLEAGKMKLKISENKLKDFLELLTSSFDSLAETKGITFIKDLADIKNNQNAFFDPDSLQKIINNLLSNAFKFTPEDGMIKIKASEDNGMLVFKVIDTGPGLSESDKLKIFDRFQQASNTVDHHGTGVGLTLCRELVYQHKGELRLDSELGKGSTFIVTIPIEKNAFKSSEIVSLMNRNIIKNIDSTNDSLILNLAEGGEELPILLIVEDNRDMQQYLVSCMQDVYRVYTASNGKEGLQIAESILPDIIISDWMMPGMNGKDFCLAIKSDIKTSHIPIIMLTAKADNPSKLEGLGIGADDYLTKPFNHKELVVRAANLIKQREALRQKYGETIFLAPMQSEITSPDKSFLENVMTIVNENISNEAFSVEEFSDKMNMSRMQLHRKLKALVDQSASEFIRNLRLEAAKEVLKNNKLNVSEVAYAHGFGNLSYFSKVFKEKYGTLPSEYQSSP